VRDWSAWLGDKIRLSRRSGAKEDALEQQLVSEFAKYEANDLRAGGATEDELQDYETADPSYMAVSAAIRYWQKYHPDQIAGSGD